MRSGRWESNLLELLGFDQRISSSNLLSANLLEIKRASVLLRVPVGPTEDGPAPALETRQPDPFPTNRTPIRLRWLLLLLLDDHSHVGILISVHFRQGQSWRIGERSEERGGWRRRRSRKRILNRRLDRRLLLLLETVISVAFRTEIHRRRTSEEAAVVCAEPVPFLCLESVLLRHMIACST